MGNIGDSMSGTPIPPVGTSGTTYASEIDDFLTEVKARLEAKVPLTSIAAGTLDLANNPIQNAEYVSFQDGSTSPTTPAHSLQVYGDDLWYVGTGSNYVQITAGAGLNASGIGGITGDYGGVNPAQLRYVNADTEFYAYSNYGTLTPAYIWARKFDVDSATGSGNRVSIAYNTSSTYTLTLPAKPASTQVLQMDSSGNIAATATPTATDYKVTGTGFLIYPEIYSVDAANNVNVTVTSRKVTATGASWTYCGPALPLRLNDRVTQIVIYVSTTGGGGTISLVKRIAGVETVVATTSIGTWGAGSNQFILGSPYTLAGGQVFVGLGGTNTGVVIEDIHVYYDHP